VSDDQVHGFSRRDFVTAAGMLPLARMTGAVATTAAEPHPLQIQRLAWAGIRLELGDVTLFIDAIAPDPKSGQAGPPLDSSRTRRFALVTHHHGDHCDPVALKPLLGESGYLVAHDETARLFDNRIVNVQRSRSHEPILLSRGNGEFVAWCVAGSDGLGGPQFSWIVDGGGKRVIHCGDTAWHGGWWSIARVYGPFDAAFLPINGFRQIGGMFTHVEQPMSLTPDQAALAARILGARMVIPIHYGGAGNAGYVEESHALERFVHASKAQGVASRVLAPGDVIEL